MQIKSELRLVELRCCAETVKDDSCSHHAGRARLLFLRQQMGAQLLPELRNSPFSVICSEEVLLGDRPFLWDVTA